MLILFDHGTPRGVMSVLREHTVVTAFEKGWDRLKNGALLKPAGENGVELLLATDRRMQYQQNLQSRKIAIAVITGTTRWTRVRLHLQRVAAAVNASQTGGYTEVAIPFG